MTRHFTTVDELGSTRYSTAPSRAHGDRCFTADRRCSEFFDG